MERNSEDWIPERWSEVAKKEDVEKLSEKLLNLIKRIEILESK